MNEWNIPVEMSSACFVTRRLFNVLNIDAVRIIYFACCHSLIKYGTIFLEKLD